MGDRVRLRYIQMDTDFRKSEYTQLMELREERPKMVDGLRGSDVVCFVSRQRNQVVFVRATRMVANGRGGEVAVVASVRWRIPSGGTWHPLMLANYARACGMRLDGVPLFEEHFKRILERSVERLK